MRHLFVIPAVLFALALCARAMSDERPITPNQLDQQNYKFAVSANTASNGVAFHVTITAKSGEIDPGSEADLAVVAHTKEGRGASSTTSIGPFAHSVPIAFKKDKRTWTADFTLPRESLKTPGLCFVFSEFAHAMENGKSVTMPSVTFYEIKLKEFVKE
jgi:hypothetical protein